MNVRETTAYLNRIGLELRPSRVKPFRWALAPQGEEPWTHFMTLVELWDYMEDTAIGHFQEELAAVEILKACDAGIGSRWALMDAWLAREGSPFPKFIYKIIDRAAATITSLPPNWREEYARLIQPDWALSPCEPILGRVLHSKLIALKGRDSALCQPRTVRGQHVKSRCAEVDRGAAAHQNGLNATS